MLFPSLDCALINGHLKFLRIACIQLVAMVVARISSQSHACAAGCGAAMATIGSAPTAWGAGGGGGGRHVTSCQGLSPPFCLLSALKGHDRDVVGFRYFIIGSCYEIVA